MVYCIKDIIKKYTKLSNSILQFLYTFILSFTNMLEILQAKNNEKIVLVRLGAFYIATGRDAILLHTI